MQNKTSVKYGERKRGRKLGYFAFSVKLKGKGGNCLVYPYLHFYLHKNPNSKNKLMDTKQEMRIIDIDSGKYYFS
jgi:hypothetical protein